MIPLVCKVMFHWLLLQIKSSDDKQYELKKRKRSTHQSSTKCASSTTTERTFFWNAAVLSIDFVLFSKRISGWVKFSFSCLQCRQIDSFLCSVQDYCTEMREFTDLIVHQRIWQLYKKRPPFWFWQWDHCLGGPVSQILATRVQSFPELTCGVREVEIAVMWDKHTVILFEHHMRTTNSKARIT